MKDVGSRKVGNGLMRSARRTTSGVGFTVGSRLTPVNQSDLKEPIPEKELPLLSLSDLNGFRSDGAYNLARVGGKGEVINVRQRREAKISIRLLSKTATVQEPIPIRLFCDHLYEEHGPAKQASESLSDVQFASLCKKFAHCRGPKERTVHPTQKSINERVAFDDKGDVVKKVVPMGANVAKSPIKFTIESEVGHMVARCLTDAGEMSCTPENLCVISNNTNTHMLNMEYLVMHFVNELAEKYGEDVNKMSYTVRYETYPEAFWVAKGVTCIIKLQDPEVEIKYEVPGFTYRPATINDVRAILGALEFILAYEKKNQLKEALSRGLLDSVITERKQPAKVEALFSEQPVERALISQLQQYIDDSEIYNQSAFDPYILNSYHLLTRSLVVSKQKIKLAQNLTKALFEIQFAFQAQVLEACRDHFKLSDEERISLNLQRIATIRQTLIAAIEHEDRINADSVMPFKWRRRRELYGILESALQEVDRENTLWLSKGRAFPCAKFHP